jgi:hypothetical protein
MGIGGALDCGRQLIGTFDPDREDLQAELSSCRLHPPDIYRMPRISGIPKHGHSDQPWQRFLQQFEPLPFQFLGDGGQTSDISTRMRKARDQSGSDRIGYSRHPQSG